MWSRFQTDSKRPLREAQGQDVLHRLLAEEVVDAEDLRLVEDARARVALSARAEARSVPNGFSMIIRARSVEAAAPSISTMPAPRRGGTDR